MRLHFNFGAITFLQILIYMEKGKYAPGTNYTVYLKMNAAISKFVKDKVFEEVAYTFPQDIDLIEETIKLKKL